MIAWFELQAYRIAKPSNELSVDVKPLWLPSRSLMSRLELNAVSRLSFVLLSYVIEVILTFK
jgi:hypothetical protein